jgi:S1-C subfamily serine protease
MGKWRVLVIALVVGLGGVASADNESVRDVFKRVRDAVVVIHVPGEVGSGVLVDKRGYVLTAAHVVQAAPDVEVEFSDGEKMPAKVVTSEPAADVALVLVSRLPASPVIAPLADSDTAEIGDRILIIGAPMGISYTLTAGILSGRRDANKLYGGFEEGELFQTDAAINPGNSGGPLLNMQGEVIGIVSHILTSGGGSEGLGFAVTSNSAKKLLMEGRGLWTGVEFYPLRGKLARLFNLPQPAGAVVQKVAPGSLGAKLRLKPAAGEITYKDETIPVDGDTVLAVGGIEISAQNLEAIRGYLAGLKPGDTLRVKVLRDGKVEELETTAD